MSNKLQHVKAWRCKIKGSDGPWSLIDCARYEAIKGRTDLEFDPLISASDRNDYKQSTDRSVAVSLSHEFMPMDTAPLGVKVQCLNEGNVAIYATVTSTTRHLYKGWYPVPKMSKR